MKLTDAEVERLAKMARSEWNELSFSDNEAWQTLVRAIIDELPEPTAPEWATPEAKAVLDAVMHPILDRIWPPAPGHLSSVMLRFKDGGQFHFGPDWWGPFVEARNAYAKTLKPKTKVLPERWLVWYTSSDGQGVPGGMYATKEMAEEAAALYPRAYIRHIPAQTVTVEER